jgi:microsomal prostaglandin-E synthase 2
MLGLFPRKPLTFALRAGSSARISHFSTAAAEITLYQYAICPFCNIVKSVLHYSKTPYQAVEVNPLTKAEIKWSKDYKKVPIASLGDTHFFGSDDIVKGLLVKDDNNSTQLVATSEETSKWTKYASDELAPLLYPNLCNTITNSYQAFDYVHQVNSFSTVQRYSIQSIGSLAMYFAASKIKSKDLCGVICYMRMCVNV